MLQPGTSGHGLLFAHYLIQCKHKKHKSTQNAFARINNTLRVTRYAGHGPVPGQMATVHRTGQNRKRGPAWTAATGKRETTGNEETRKRGPAASRLKRNRVAIHFYATPSFFSPRINASTHHDMLIRTRPPFPGPVFPANAARRSRSANAIGKRIHKRLKVYCADCASKSLRVQAGGRGCVRASAFFCIIITPRTKFFAISASPLAITLPIAPRLPASSRNRLSCMIWDAQSGDRSSIRGCSVM